MAKVLKKRNWTIVLYPESAPENWCDILKQTGIKFAVSPLHDKDLSGEAEQKKAHYHIILCYPGPTTYNCVKSLCDALNCPIPKAIESVGGLYRYFTHKDDPNKAQYDEADIRQYNGFNIRDFEDLTKAELNQLKMKVQLFIREYEITEYSLLMDLLLDNEMFDEWSVAASNTLFFDRYIGSRRYDKRDSE